MCLKLYIFQLQSNIKEIKVTLKLFCFTLLIEFIIIKNAVFSESLRIV